MTRYPVSNSLWRISRHDDLEGLGGERSDGRWHTAAKGKRIVYLSEHPAVALLEVLANLKGNPKLFPDAYRLMHIAVPDKTWALVQPVGDLPDDWRENINQTRQMGDIGSLRLTLRCCVFPLRRHRSHSTTCSIRSTRGPAAFTSPGHAGSPTINGSSTYKP